jgi:hypothetical protein
MTTEQRSHPFKGLQNFRAIKAIIPDTLRTSFSDWEKLVKDEFKLHINLTAVGAGKSFLKVLRTWKLYGAFMVPVKLPDEKKSKVSHLGVSPHGLVTLEQGTRVRLPLDLFITNNRPSIRKS